MKHEENARKCKKMQENARKCKKMQENARKCKNYIIPSLIFLALSPTLHANHFWNPDLNENLTHVTKRTTVDYFTSYEAGKPWPGVGPNGEVAGTAPLSYSRIPAMTITDDNKMVVMFDLRWNKADDHNRIDPGIAISEDGGYTWTRKTAWTFNKGNDPLRRTMDPTILHNPIDGSLYVMHGTWASGNQNWYRDRFNYFYNNIWAATIHKSTDGGKTWEKNAEFSKLSNAEIFAKVQKGENNPTLGFLGGVGSGIIMRDGTLVFPIQTAHANGIATTIMYSKDNGKTWDMPETTQPPAPNQSSLENMVFEMGNKLIMTGRETRVNHKQADKRWAYYTEDMGKTWHHYPEAEFGSSTAQPTQGSSIYVTLPNGRRVLLVSKPKGNNDDWARGNLALYMLDAKNPAHFHEVTIVRPGSGNPAGAGYSSLAYKEGNLFIAYEDDGNITVKNLTEHMEAIQAKALEWQLPDEIEADVAQINALTHLNKGQKEELVAKMKRANDYAIAQSFSIDKAMASLKTNSADLHEQAKALVNVLPSRQNQFSRALNHINAITSPDNTTFVNYLGVHALYDNLYRDFLALNTKLDFTPYVKQAQQFNEYNHDILYRSFDKVFAHYDTGSKYNRLSLGVNTDINANLTVGAFVEHRHKKQNSYEAGVRAKYEQDNHQVAGFVRYRGVKYDGVAERNHNVDGYLNYAYQVKLHDDLSVSPAVGAYVSRSSRTLIDEDVAINKRIVYAGDVGLNIAYKLGTTNITIRPNIALINDGATLAQSNDAANTRKIKSHNVVYGLSAGVEKHFAKGLILGSNLKLQKYGSQHSEANIGVNLSYKF